MTMTFTCSSCGKKHQIEIISRIDAETSPELLDRLRTGELFVWNCPDCGAANLAVHPLIFTSSALSLLLCLSPEPLASSGDIPGYSIARQVGSVGEFIEKLKIFEAGLDDIGIEMCKFITAQEIEEHAGAGSAGGIGPSASALRFVCVEGADNELTFTYPYKAPVTDSQASSGNAQMPRMQLLRIGLNVYEDCMGIVSRNPILRDNAKGLVRIDQAWLEKYFR